MTPRQEEALRNETLALERATAELVHVLRTSPLGRLELPPIRGRAPSETDASAEEVFEQTLGALARAHRRLASRGVGLLRSRPIQTRIAGGLAGIDPTGRPRLRLGERGTD